MGESCVMVDWGGVSVVAGVRPDGYESREIMCGERRCGGVVSCSCVVFLRLGVCVLRIMLTEFILL